MDPIESAGVAGKGGSFVGGWVVIIYLMKLKLSIRISKSEDVTVCARDPPNAYLSCRLYREHHATHIALAVSSCCLV